MTVLEFTVDHAAIILCYSVFMYFI